MNYYNLSINEICDRLNASVEGLSSVEASKRLKYYGKNQLTSEKSKSNFVKFVSEFKDIMIIMLIISSIVSAVVSYINHESYINSIAIIVIVIINAVMGYIQEKKADIALESLKQMQVTHSKVIRNGKVCIVCSEDITIGDVLVLEAGDKVPADARIIDTLSLRVNESALTGESDLVNKNNKIISGEKNISDISNMVFSGTSVEYGKCRALVVGVGMDTEFGTIAKTLDEEKEMQTPLQKKITDMSKIITFVIVVIIITMFIIGSMKAMPLTEVFILSISLAVAAIPEGLPAILTVILSIGMSDLAKKNAIVRKMSSVETLGSTEVICSDKTGTITQNKMQVREIYYDNEFRTIDELKKDNMLFNIMILNNDVILNEEGYIGDPTEIALYECLKDVLNIDDIRNKHKRINEIPFDSDRKMMSTINKVGDDVLLFTKGSFDSIISHTKYTIENDKVVKLTKDKIEKLKAIEKEESSKSYRLLAYAYKKLKEPYILDDLENDLIFAGLTALIDPPREDVKESIMECKKAHIRPIMITGDSLSTASSIAKEIGILNNPKEAITGIDLDKMSVDEFMEAVNKYSVFARVSPSNKLSIVKALEAQGKIVAMTGDGVNDAPALKMADIGVGMGITGTEVSKGASDIVLADDSFSTIVDAIKEGRRIFDNIRNVLVYLLTGNIAEILIVFLGMIYGIEVFLPIQLLYLNLVTDSLPAISLAFEKASPDIMSREVRKSTSTFFTKFIYMKMFLSAMLKLIAILVVYFVGYKIYNADIANTMAFLTLVLLEMLYSISCKNLKENVIGKKMFSNMYLNIVMIILIAVQIIVFSSPIGSIFNVHYMNAFQTTYSILMAVTVLLLDELFKPILYKIFKD